MLLLIALLGQSCLSIDSEKILASHLAARIESLQAVPSDTVFGFTPRVGVRRIISGFELVAFARKHGVSTVTANEICIIRPAHPLNEKELVEYLKTASKKLTGEDEVWVELIDYSRHSLPSGEIEFTRSGLTFSKDTVLWKGLIHTPSGSRFPLWAKVRILIAGEVLTSKKIAPSHEVKTGDIVSVEVAQGNARLSLDAKAETSGGRGERVFLRNPVSGRRFEARIAGPGRAVVGETHALRN